MNKKKITLIDVLIIIFIAICAIVVGLKMFNKTSDGAKKTIRYKVLISEVSNQSAENIKPDEKVQLDMKDKQYGKVVDVEIKNASILSTDIENGREVLSTSNLYKDVYLTVEADVEDMDYGYTIGKQKIRIGEKQPIVAKTYAMNGYVVDIEE